MNLHTINTGLFKLDGGAMFGVVPKVLWSRHIEPDENNLCTWSTRCLLIENDNQLILIDTGLGDKQSEKFFGYYYQSETKSIESALNEKGFTTDDVTDVILTHLHFDHCGGAIKWNKDKTGYVPTFKNATYWSNQNHWKWATEPNARERASFLKENILPIQESGQLKFIDQSDFISSTPFDNMEMVFVNGHTESMMLPLLDIKGQKILYTADLFPSTVHIPIAWVMGYDTRPLLTLDEKKKTLDLASKENWIFLFEHDAYTECCTLKSTEKGVFKDAVLKLNEVVS